MQWLIITWILIQGSNNSESWWRKGWKLALGLSSLWMLNCDYITTSKHLSGKVISRNWWEYRVLNALPACNFYLAGFQRNDYLANSNLEGWGRHCWNGMEDGVLMGCCCHQPLLGWLGVLSKEGVYGGWDEVSLVLPHFVMDRILFEMLD